MATPNAPCGEGCYLTPDAAVPICPELEPCEEMLYQAAASRFRIGDACAIAKFTGTRSCAEWRAVDIARREADGAARGADAASAAKAGGKRPLTDQVLDPRSKQRRKASDKPSDEASDGLVHAYVPCEHEGRCTVSHDCGCVSRNHLCEKYCQCTPECPRRRRGCSCIGACDKRTCPCYASGRECDPDLCTSCGASEFAYQPSPNEDLPVVRSTCRCKNVGIQRQQYHRLRVAPSEVAGWGIFVDSPIKKGEFISEYSGEIISQDEAERRGRLYDYEKLSFLFNLNEENVVDSTRRGNKMRFTNHSSDPNCFARVMLVQGVHKIGIYAKTDIPAGRELFYDYRYGPTDALKYVAVERIPDQLLALPGTDIRMHGHR